MFLFSLVSEDTSAVNSISNKKEEKEEYDGPFKPAKVLKEGSVLDILRNPGEIMNFFLKDTAEKMLTWI